MPLWHTVKLVSVGIKWPVCHFAKLINILFFWWEEWKLDAAQTFQKLQIQILTTKWPQLKKTFCMKYFITMHLLATWWLTFSVSFVLCLNVVGVYFLGAAVKRQVFVWRNRKKCVYRPWLGRESCYNISSADAWYICQKDPSL